MVARTPRVLVARTRFGGLAPPFVVNSLGAIWRADSQEELPIHL